MMDMRKVKVNESKTVETAPTYNANNIGELRGLLASARSQGLTVAIIRIPARLFTIDEKYQGKDSSTLYDEMYELIILMMQNYFQ